MRKMKLTAVYGIGKTLTRNELKNVWGGSDSYSGSPCPPHGPKVDACTGKTSSSSCSFRGTDGRTYYGTCQWAPYCAETLYCSNLNVW